MHNSIIHKSKFSFLTVRRRVSNSISTERWLIWIIEFIPNENTRSKVTWINYLNLSLVFESKRDFGKGLQWNGIHLRSLNKEKDRTISFFLHSKVQWIGHFCTFRIGKLLSKGKENEESLLEACRKSWNKKLDESIPFWYDLPSLYKTVWEKQDFVYVIIE